MKVQNSPDSHLLSVPLSSSVFGSVCCAWNVPLTGTVLHHALCRTVSHSVPSFYTFSVTEHCRLFSKPPSLTIHETLWQSGSQHQILSLLGLQPLQRRRSSKLTGAYFSPHPPCTRGQTRFPHQFSPGFPTAETQVSHSIMQFIPSAVMERHRKLVPLRRGPPTKDPWAFIPSQSKHMQISSS